MKMPVCGPSQFFSHYGVVMYLPKLITSRETVGWVWIVLDRLDSFHWSVV